MGVRVSRVVLVLGGLLMASWLKAAKEANLRPLPEAVTNNAVAASNGEAGTKIFSFMGIGAKKTWDAVTNSAYEMDLKTGAWEQKRAVPGAAGRLAASAVALGGRVFILGGYIVDGDGHETTVADVNVFVPFEDRYYRGKDIPVAVDDAVVGVYSGRYIFVIGGWSKTEAVRNVQIYDTEKDEWRQAAQIPGTPVFGHAGAIAGDTIVYVDGAYRNPDNKGPKYLASDECWTGKIPNPKKGDIGKIAWTRLPAHPGNARYRIAAGAGVVSKKTSKVYFSGGSDNPYNYNGIGYDGRASEPSPVAFAFDVKSGTWETLDERTPEPLMDARSLLVTERGLLVVGGMSQNQQVTAKVTVVKAGGKK